MPVCGSHRRPPLQPPVWHCVGPGRLVEKSQPVRPQIRPDTQLSGTSNSLTAPAACSQPVGTFGISPPVPGVVYIAEVAILGFYECKVRGQV